MGEFEPAPVDEARLLLPGSTSQLARLLEKKAPRTAAGIAIGQAAWPVAKWARGQWRKARTFTVRVPGNPGDALYEELHARILTQIPEGKRRALVASGRDTTRPTVDEFGNFLPQYRSGAVTLRYDGSREQHVMLGGHKVKIAVTDAQARGARQPYKPPEIVFTVLSQAARDAVLAEIEDAHRQTRSKGRQPSFWLYNNWDEWERVEEIAERSLDSVILPEGQLERIMTDIERFLGSEAEYVRRCMPWHRGHAYWGPPGTGKTSVARAVATHFGLDVWYLPLSDVRRDGGLLKAVHRIKGKSVLLLEDIDVFHSATSRDDEGGGVTLSGVLNSLDGISTPHGLIVIMTSNTPEVLEDAVIRTGRADHVEQFLPAGPVEARRFLQWWYPDDGEECPKLPGSLSMPYSDIAEACKRSESILEAVKRLR